MRVAAGQLGQHVHVHQRRTSASTSSLGVAPGSWKQGPRPASTASRCRRQRPSRQQPVVKAFKTNSAPTVTDTKAPALLTNAKNQLTVSWAGAGIFFFWQLGCMRFLAEQFDLTRVAMSGASGGALAAVLAGCGVDADRVIEHAYELSKAHNIWERPLGLLGLWGSLIEKWLDDLLPDNAHEMCRDRISVVVTTVPDLAQVAISDFSSKADLINCCMASAHIPFFLDYKLTRRCRGKKCVDGSFPDFFTGLNSELLRTPSGISAIVFDYFDDTNLKRRGRMDMLEVKSYEEVRRMYDLGYQYARKLHADGRFHHYELAEVLLQGQHGHMSEVLVPENGNGQVAAQQQPQQAAADHMQAVAAIKSAAAVGQQAAAAAGQKLPRGSELELEQDERELRQQIQEQQQEQQRELQEEKVLRHAAQ